MINIETLKELDLCFVGVNDVSLYDYNTLDMFLDEIVNDLNTYKDEEEYKSACQKVIQKAKSLVVYEKYHFNFSPCRLREYIMEFGEDNFSRVLNDYETCITDKAEKLIEKLCKEINKHNKTYETCHSLFGFIDLSNEVIEALINKGIK